MSRSSEPVDVPPEVVGSIVVAVDGSEHAERATRWAAAQAALEHRRLVAVAVGPDQGSHADVAADRVRDLHPDLSVHALALPGDPREVLVDLSTQAHMLVVGSRGRGAVRRILLGSVSAAVSAHATCPVVICRPPSPDQARPGVVVGADTTPESLPVIEFAYRQAALHDLPLTVVHCFWDAVAAVSRYQTDRGREAPEPDLEDLRAALSRSVAGFAELYPDVHVSLTLRHGFVEEALSPRHGGWDLIVVGRHPMTSLTRLVMGSFSTSVLERAHTTVAVVPETAPSS